jgi:hypothetical protein
MNRILTAALIPIMTAPLLLAGSTAASAEPATGCAMPVPERNYTDSQLTYRLAVDLTHCDWWDRTPIQLDASLDRFDATDGHGSTTVMLCGTDLAEASSGPRSGRRAGRTEAPMAGEDPDPAGEGADPQDGMATTRQMSATCEVEVVLEHPGAELAHYRGSVFFPWERGRRSISFSALCGSGPRCVDLPVDPTRDLADAYDQIGGDPDVG